MIDQQQLNTKNNSNTDGNEINVEINGQNGVKKKANGLSSDNLSDNEDLLENNFNQNNNNAKEHFDDDLDENEEDDDENFNVNLNYFQKLFII